MASAGSVGKSSASLTVKQSYPQFAICIDNHGLETSLSVGKVYQVIKPLAHDASYDLRVIDEEGEDYLYPAARFVRVELPAKARKAVSRMSHP
jgi:hypothetical protein